MKPEHKSKKNLFTDFVFRYDSHDDLRQSSYHHLVAVGKDYCKADYWKKRNSSMLAKYSEGISFSKNHSQVLNNPEARKTQVFVSKQLFKGKLEPWSSTEENNYDIF